MTAVEEAQWPTGIDFAEFDDGTILTRPHQEPDENIKEERAS